MDRTIKDYVLLVLKGMGMGAADVVPGVSGGTIAFISGIYKELLGSISSVNFTNAKVLFSEGPKVFWKNINGNFLVALFIGIGASVASLAKIITFLLSTYPELIWGFFFGLIVASIIFIGKTIRSYNLPTIISLIIGTATAYWITILEPSDVSEQYWFIFLSGAIAICAMILPGISGSFILLLMGMYNLILSAIKNIEFVTLAVFAGGCITGLLGFSKVLSWMLKEYYNLTVSLLTGFMIGSLNKVWPWKLTTLYRTNSHGIEVPFIQKNVLPGEYENDNQLIYVILLAIVGFGLIFLLEKFSNKQKELN